MTLVWTLGAVAAAVAAFLVGVRGEPFDTGGYDAAATILWVLALSSAFRRLDCVPRLAPAVSATTASGVFALAAFGNQDVVATAAVTVAGACVVLLAASTGRRRSTLGRPGMLAVGYVLALLTIEIRPAVPRPGSLLVPLLLAAVPLLDILVVSTSRFLRGARLRRGERDHLADRLVARGLAPGAAVAMLVAVQVTLAAVAVFVGRGVLSATAGGTIGAAVLGSVALLTGTVSSHAGDATGIGRRRKLAVVGLAAGLGLMAVPAAVAVARARLHTSEARALVEQALDAARRGDTAMAEARFAAAANSFSAARDRLDDPFVSIGFALPVLGPNLRAATNLSEAGMELSAAGERLSASIEPEQLEVVDGTLALDELRSITPDLAAGARLLDDVVAEVGEIDDPYLVAPVHDATRQLAAELEDAEREADNVVAAARLGPAIFGGDGPRRYFLAVQNSAEQRATGGLIGNWGILVAEDGKVRLERFERVSALNDGGDPGRALTAPDDFVRRYARFDPAGNWQNVNMSPDFPTVAQIIADLYPQSGGEPIDGVLAVDSQGLAALLELTGPVNVPGWPVPLSADNVVDVTLRDSYEAFAGTPERADFLGDVAETVVDAATDGELGKPAKIAEVLGGAAREGHLLIWFARPAEQALAEQLDVAGATPPVRSDSLLVTTQNAGGNKLDYYLRRHLEYEVRLEPDAPAEQAAVSAHLEVRLDNGAPAAGLAPIAIGPYDERFVAGENRSFVSVYTPARFRAAALDNEQIGLESTSELDRNAFSSFLSVHAGRSRVLAVDVEGTVELGPEGWYSLDLVRQPGLYPDDVTVTVEVPAGWRIIDAEGLEVDGTTGRARLALDRTATVRVRVEPDRGLWDRLHAGT